ncbi:ABC transporter ATP-binding protein [Formicincola oecophyllae]|uniref:ABC transporter ATP-binding protein n=1 Tax=Formicincola oecophyllae TaxID=2558361 RepID=A0A4Y6UBI1_9PROT|nr:ABC transporter ATP-binding protein [Formicincola oecophyllae]QDH13928.1 ABC transporter ATP-binding protein [Formicincola oecophyllae]
MAPPTIPAPDGASANALLVRDLTVRYGRKPPVINQLTLKPVLPGVVTALLGPNGCGKSTLLRALAGLVPALGQVWLGGQDFGALAPAQRARECAYLPQSLPPPIHLQVLEAVMVARRAGSTLSAGEAMAQSLAMLEKLGIGALAGCWLDELSGGQRQLVGLAQALVRQPRMLLLDEPLSALDLRHQVAVMEAVRAETAARTMVTLIVMHDLNIALQRADDGIYLKKGALVAQGPLCSVTTPAVLEEVYGVRSSVHLPEGGRPHIMVEGVA